jgi:hypothetical protein
VRFRRPDRSFQTGTRAKPTRPDGRHRKRRLVTGGMAFALACVLAATPALRADQLGGLLASIGGLGLAGFAYALVRGRAWAVPWAVVVLGGVYAGSLFLPERGVDRQAAVVAAAFVLLAELTYWTLELRSPISPEPGMLERRAALVAATTVGALLVAGVAIAASSIPLGGGLLGDLLGVFAAVAALAVVAWLAERGRAQSRT